MTTSALALMTTNVNVGINEVVSVFVAKYEDGLFAKKDELSAKIRIAKQELATFLKDLVAEVDKSQYNVRVDVLNVLFFAEEVEVSWEGNSYYNIPKNSLTVSIQQRPAQEGSKSSHFKTIALPISAVDISEHERLKAELEALNTELIDTMALIKSVSRKERQIRGRISEMKLAESGYSELVNSAELLQLVHVK